MAEDNPLKTYWDPCPMLLYRWLWCDNIMITIMMLPSYELSDLCFFLTHTCVHLYLYVNLFIYTNIMMFYVILNYIILYIHMCVWSMAEVLPMFVWNHLWRSLKFLRICWRPVDPCRRAWWADSRMGNMLPFHSYNYVTTQLATKFMNATMCYQSFFGCFWRCCRLGWILQSSGANHDCLVSNHAVLWFQLSKFGVWIETTNPTVMESCHKMP